MCESMSEVRLILSFLKGKFIIVSAIILLEDGAVVSFQLSITHSKELADYQISKPL